MVTEETASPRTSAVAETAPTLTQEAPSKFGFRLLSNLTTSKLTRFVFLATRKSNDGQRRQGGGEGLKVERRDQSKNIKKDGGKGGPKKITIESLRRGEGERGGQGKKQGGKGNDGQKGDKRGGKKESGHRGGKGDRGGKKGGKPFKKAVKQTADDLDKDMESYWVRGGHTEVGKLISPKTKFLLQQINVSTTTWPTTSISRIKKSSPHLQPESRRLRPTLRSRRRNETPIPSQ